MVAKCVYTFVCIYVYIYRHIERVAWKRFPRRIESGQFPYYHFILLYSLRLLLFTLPQGNGHHHHTYIYHTFHTLVHNKRWSKSLFQHLLFPSLLFIETRYSLSSPFLFLFSHFLYIFSSIQFCRFSYTLQISLHAFFPSLLCVMI